MPSAILYNFTQLKMEPVTNPDLARTIAVLIKPSTTLTRGTILGEITLQPGVYTKYNPNASDGTNVAKAILAYDVVTDANGNPTGVTFPYPPFPSTSIPAYVSGEFDCATINTAMGDAGVLLADAIAAGFGKLEQGTVASGTVKI
jgi:hypothetical protein